MRIKRTSAPFERFIETIEDLNFSVNPDTGTDPSINSRIRYTTQSEVAAYGKFATVKGALRVLPYNISHSITFTIDDGSYTADNDFFEGLERFSLRRDGRFIVTSSSVLRKVSGTITSDVASHTGGYSITLNSDPGYTANEYRNLWLYVTAGTGSGEYKIIRSHNGTNFEVAGNFTSLDTTSDVEIYEPSVTLNVSGDLNNFFLPRKTGITSLAALQMKGMKLSPISAYPVVWFYNGSVWLDAILTDAKITTFQGVRTANLEGFSAYGGGTGFAGIYATDSTTFRCGTSNSSWFVRDYYYGVYLSGTGDYPSAQTFLEDGAMDDCLVAAVYLKAVEIDVLNARGQGSPIGISSDARSFLRFDISQLTGAAGGVEGTNADINLNGLYLSYNDLDNTRYATVQPNGNLMNYAKVLQVERATTAGTGTLTYTNSGTTLAYTAPGDSVGSAVNVGAGGYFILKSNNNKWIQIWVNPTLPSGNTSDTFTVAQAGSVIEHGGCVLELY
jgi:hypothetical protein